MKQKTIKAWAILKKSKKTIENDGGKHLYIYSREPAWETGNRVVSCIITYTL